MPDMFNTHLATLNCKHKWFLSCGATKNTGPFTQRDNSHSTINTCHSEPFLFLKWLIIEMSVQLAAAVSVPLVSPLLRRHASLKALSLLVQSSARAAHRRPPYALEGMKRNQPLLSWSARVFAHCDSLKLVPSDCDLLHEICVLICSAVHSNDDLAFGSRLYKLVGFS